MNILWNGQLESFLDVTPNNNRRILASIMARAVSQNLGIHEPPIRFFYEGRFAKFNGFTDGEIIYVSAELDDGMVCRTIIHEARHIFQRSNAAWRSKSEATLERDAVLFELAWPR